MQLLWAILLLDGFLKQTVELKIAQEQMFQFLKHKMLFDAT